MTIGDKVLKIMEEYHIGIRRTSEKGGWWPDTLYSNITDKQTATLSFHLNERTEPFETAEEAIMFVVRLLGLWKWPG